MACAWWSASTTPGCRRRSASIAAPPRMPTGSRRVRRPPAGRTAARPSSAPTASCTAITSRSATCSSSAAHHDGCRCRRDRVTTPGAWLGTLDAGRPARAHGSRSGPAGPVTTAWPAGRTECGCAADGRWKAPLRQAFDRLAGASTRVTEATPGAARPRRLGVPRPVSWTWPAAIWMPRPMGHGRAGACRDGHGVRAAAGRTAAADPDAGPGVAPVHVRQLRLVLGRSSSARDRPGAPLRGPCGATGRRGLRLPARGPARRRTRRGAGPPRRDGSGAVRGRSRGCRPAAGSAGRLLRWVHLG